MNLDLVIYRLRSAADRSARYSERHFKLFGLLAVFLIPATTFVERAVASPAFDTLYVRSAAGGIGLLLLFHDRLPHALVRRMPLIWIFSITFILPFCFGVILTLNASLTPAGQEPSPVWVYQYLVALFIFIQLINHGPLSVLLWLIATILVFLVCAMTSSPNVEALKTVWLFPLPVYLTALFVGSVTNRNVHMVQTEQLRAASAIGSNIAHELRTPLASIRLLSRSIGRFLPNLVAGYKQARDSGFDCPEITSQQLSQLRDGLESIQNEVNYSNTIIDMLLMNTSERPAAQFEFQVFRISDALYEAATRFPFNNSAERKRLKTTVVEDFLVRAPKLLVVHVFFNLIKNGIYFVQKGGDGSVEVLIGSREGSGSNTVEVTDRGTGVPANLQPRIFDRFFTAGDAGQGAGIGLSFCKMVMESIGGEIQCESREGEYTTFRLVFPAAGDVDSEGLPA